MFIGKFSTLRVHEDQQSQCAHKQAQLVDHSVKSVDNEQVGTKISPKAFLCLSLQIHEQWRVLVDVIHLAASDLRRVAQPKPIKNIFLGIACECARSHIS